jgi:pilus assembly protein CpaE
MCIRGQTIDDGSGPVLQSGPVDTTEWVRRATMLAVFNPKGGVGKTTIATNLAAALQVGKQLKVLLVDADTVTGHVTTSLGLEQVRTVVDSWRDEQDGGPTESLSELAADHVSGMKVVALTSSPLQNDILEPARVAAALQAARRGFDFVVVDLHPSYSELNRAIFDVADRILVPVTPDVPALRAAVQFRDVATDLGFHDKLAMVVNRANSGVSVADMERTVGMPSLALIRSGGLFFVRASNEGRTIVERYPKERVSEDFAALSDRVAPGTSTVTVAALPARSPFRLFGRQKEIVRA